MDFCFSEVFFWASLESKLLILAALFLWIKLFLAARSAKETALIISLFFLLFLAALMAISRFERMLALTLAFFFDDLKALFAVLVTGMIVSIIKGN